jgi:type II secretory pathway pseudopilin PulG
VVKLLRPLRRLRSEDGFGLIELSVAMVMLNIGLLAIVAAFNSGAVALQRASLVANGTTLADTFMERYRGYRNCQIYLDTGSNGGIPTTGIYASDPAYNASQITQTYAGSGALPATCSMGTAAWTCPTVVSTAQMAVTAHNTCALGADGRSYIVDAYVVAVTVSGGTTPSGTTYSGGTQKQVTIVVRDPNHPTMSLVRESTTFDPLGAS